MNRNSFSKSPYHQFEIHQINSPGKIRDSPTSSILKTPTAIFVTTRNSSAKTKKLTFANGPVDLQTLKNGTHESNISVDSGGSADGDKKLNNGEISFEDNIVEVAISPVKTMKVSPDSWNAFLEYKKYNDYANETEKTDYTYSRLSKYRHKEIIPGFPIRPNLSRSSISSTRSSFSSPSGQISMNESYHLKNYDFSLSNHSDSEIFNDLNQSGKFGRSKYYLRSSNYDWKGSGDSDSAARNYVETDFYGHSPEEKITRSYAYTTTEASEPTTHYYGKVRKIELDDADIDEVDDPSLVGQFYSENRYYTGSDSNANRGLGTAVRSQTASGNFKNFFTTMFLYVTSIGTVTRDLFSKYILRRQDDHWDRSMYALHNWKNENYARSTTAGSWLPWQGKRNYYSTANYYSDDYYGRSSSWLQRIYYYFNDRFSKIRNLILGDSSAYASRYQGASRKRKFWWFLIPLLLLAGLWLFKAEQESGFLTDQYKALDCRTNGFLTSLEDTIKPVWRSGYIAYKRAAVSASCYVNDSWERLKLPFSHIYDWLCSKFSNLSEGSFGFLFTFWKVLWEGLWNIIGLTRDTLSNFCLFLLNFFTDFISAVNNVLYYISRYFIDLFFTIYNSLGRIFGETGKILASLLHNFWSSLYLLLFAPRSEIKYEDRSPEMSGSSCMLQQQSIDKLTSEVNDFKSQIWDLTSIKKKIDDLELEFRKEKEFRKSHNELIDKQLDDNHKTLEKYQTTINQALHSSKKPEAISNSSIRYLLDTQSDALKQWIAQNFLLKSDAGLDENKISLLIAKYTNGTGQELVALKQELKLFIQNHRSELESLRNNFNALEANNLGGNDISLAFIKKLITDAIKLYDADKTGRVDYALETAGGQVKSIRCTETYTGSPKSYFLLGWPVYTETSSPRDAISPGMAAGQCWAFTGSQGYLVLQLSHSIRVTGFTMEHISRSLVPRGHIESAPKNFSMWGLKHEQDLEPYLFGEYVYLDNDVTLQYFPVTYPTERLFRMVELKIASNHGNPNYTCLYRIRVHGDVEPAHS